MNAKFNETDTNSEKSTFFSFFVFDGWMRAEMLCTKVQNSILVTAAPQKEEKRTPALSRGSFFVNLSLLKFHSSVGGSGCVCKAGSSDDSAFFFFFEIKIRTMETAAKTNATPLKIITG